MFQGPSEDLTREAKKVIRHSQILMEQFEQEAHERPEQKDRLLAAARRVATATSDMIDATRVGSYFCSSSSSSGRFSRSEFGCAIAVVWCGMSSSGRFSVTGVGCEMCRFFRAGLRRKCSKRE